MRDTAYAIRAGRGVYAATAPGLRRCTDCGSLYAIVSTISKPVFFFPWLSPLHAQAVHIYGEGAAVFLLVVKYKIDGTTAAVDGPIFDKHQLCTVSEMLARDGDGDGDGSGGHVWERTLMLQAYKDLHVWPCSGKIIAF